MTAYLHFGRYSAVGNEWNCARAQYCTLHVHMGETMHRTTSLLIHSYFYHMRPEFKKLQVKTEERKRAWRFTLRYTTARNRRCHESRARYSHLKKFQSRFRRDERNDMTLYFSNIAFSKGKKSFDTHTARQIRRYNAIRCTFVVFQQAISRTEYFSVELYCGIRRYDVGDHRTARPKHVLRFFSPLYRRLKYNNMYISYIHISR